MPINHNPLVALGGATGAAAVNQILTNSNDETDPSVFESRAEPRSFVLSLMEVDGSGDPIASPADNFTIELQRSIDEGETYQPYAQYTASTETEVSSNFTSAIWKFVLKSAGTNAVRVRAVGAR
jgi:hypothetical protein